MPHLKSFTIDALDISLRPRAEADMPFLKSLYHSTRAAEMAMLPWPDAMKAALLDDQFRLQDRHYTQHYLGTTFDVIEHNRQPIGRLYVHRGSIEIRVVDISLLPQCRGLGIGTVLLQALIAEATANTKPVSLRVDMTNPAQRLYQRLGFVADGPGDGIYQNMVYNRPQ